MRMIFFGALRRRLYGNLQVGGAPIIVVGENDRADRRVVTATLVAMGAIPWSVVRTLMTRSLLQES